ncbi:hypothetical protein HDF26_003556 [Pedobacter cryoconitis]|uniref:Uncharacterized protein n=1 Tax=Pedobacter cryoconitis TaxID=188932 RepID=A0A7W8ZL26_9SPHI|nr:hypothetical protein [Pedobacter cryoconitis]MBB6273096.1 hypothetical protein [Pedobacter cryoconitis]
MGSLTGKFSKGILDDFIFKAAVWSTGCFKSSVPGTMKQSMETEKNRIFPPPKNSAEALTDL